VNAGALLHEEPIACRMSVFVSYRDLGDGQLALDPKKAYAYNTMGFTHHAASLLLHSESNRVVSLRARDAARCGSERCGSRSGLPKLEPYIDL